MCLVCSVVIFALNLVQTKTAIGIFNGAVESVNEDKVIAFEDVNQLPVANVDNKCKSIPLGSFVIIVGLIIVI
jgi:hypothetical protein